jgi:hypothetical protein
MVLILGSTVTETCEHVGKLVPTVLNNNSSLSHTTGLSGKLLLSSNLTSFQALFTDPEICETGLVASGKLLKLWIEKLGVSIGIPELVLYGVGPGISSPYPITISGSTTVDIGKKWRWISGEHLRMIAGNSATGATEWRVRRYILNYDVAYPYTDWPPELDPTTGDILASGSISEDNYLTGCPDTIDLDTYSADMSVPPEMYLSHERSCYYKLEIKTDRWPDYSHDPSNTPSMSGSYYLYFGDYAYYKYP